MNFNQLDLSFYKNKNVLVTGHTGFKGSWLCMVLKNAGANVIGYSLEPNINPSLFELAKISDGMYSVIGDIRNYSELSRVFETHKPEIIFHLAAQAIVREGYAHPKETYEINAMGTVNLMESIRNSSSVKSVINVTTDKVYLNNEWVWGYRETDTLNGYDPYSNSKSCSELITDSYVKSFLKTKKIAVSCVRAGNVIGGGDFAQNRIMPDCLRAIINKKPIIIRNPHSIRPYQHVLEPIFVYLMIAMAQHKNEKYAGSYNVGPDDNGCLETGWLVKLFGEKWGDRFQWEFQKVDDTGVHESNILKLDCSKLKTIYNWAPCMALDEAIEKIVEWDKCYLNNGDITDCMRKQIKDYMRKIME